MKQGFLRTKKKNSQKRKGFSGFLRESWWVFLFSFICASTYMQAARSRNVVLKDLVHRLQEKEKEKQQALLRQQDLTLRLASQTDPAWIEMVLMKELGVVPEGYVKVHFKK